MAADNHHQCKTVTATDIENLADHLVGRAISRMTADKPEPRQRLLLAAALLRVFATEHHDGVTVEMYVGDR